MIPSLPSLRNLNPDLVPKRSREEQLAEIQRYKDAQEELERYCAEKGIPVPKMVC